MASESQVLFERLLLPWKRHKLELQVRTHLIAVPLFFLRVLQQFSSLVTGVSFPGLDHDLLLLLLSEKNPGITLVDLDANWECGSRLCEVSPIFGVIPL